MSCKHYQKLLQLNRPGELTGRQQKKLDQHVSKCSSCAQEKLKIEKASDYIALAREAKPELTEPGLLTANIMGTIRRANNYAKKSWLDFFSLPGTRLTLIGATAVLVGIFFLQEFLVLYRISQLENRMARQSYGQTALSGKVTNKFSRVSTVSLLEKSEFLKSLVINDSEIPGDRVLLKKSTLKAYLEAYRELQQENRMLLRYLREKFPELRGISLRDGLDVEEIEKIVKNKKKILKYLNRL